MESKTEELQLMVSLVSHFQSCPREIYMQLILTTMDIAIHDKTKNLVNKVHLES